MVKVGSLTIKCADYSNQMELTGIAAHGRRGFVRFGVSPYEVHNYLMHV